MDCWEYKTDNRIDSDNLRLATRNMIFTELKELKLRKTIDERTGGEWTKLYIRRAFLMTFNFLFICGCGIAIVMTNIK